MKKLVLLLLFSTTLWCHRGRAQIVLDDFTTGTQAGEGAALVSGSWVGQVTQNATTITVGGTAHDDNGWGVFNLPAFDASALQSISITAQLEAGNAAGSFNVQFFDDAFGGQAFSIPTSAFLTGIMTTVNIPLGPWLTADPTQLSAWTIGGGNSATNGPALRMSFDQLALTTTAIPEPAAWVALAGSFALGTACWRRRRQSHQSSVQIE